MRSKIWTKFNIVLNKKAQLFFYNNYVFIIMYISMLNVKNRLLPCEMLYGSSVVLCPSLSKTQMSAFYSTPILFFESISVHFLGRKLLQYTRLFRFAQKSSIGRSCGTLGGFEVFGTYGMFNSAILLRVFLE